MGNDIFTPESKSIRKIFGDTDAFYEVPNYQRPYSWDDERVDQLWDDIYDSFKDWTIDPNNSEAYFLGSIILIKNNDHFDIVDGQQRLTTLTILFSVVRDCYPNLESKTLRILQNCIKDSIDDKARMRFTTAIDKQNEFEQTIVKKVDFDSYNEKSKKKRPYINTAMNFKKKFALLEKAEIESLLNYIFENVQIITIKCYKQSFAIKLFQVLNARGLDLTASDLIKSNLMSSLPFKEQEKFITEWRSIETLAKDMDEDLDNLFSLYLYFLKGSNPKQGLYEDLTKELKGRNSNEIIFEIKKFINSYKEVMAIQHKAIYCLKYLNHQLYWKTILASAKFQNRTDINELAIIIRNFYYSHWIAGYNTTKIKQASFRLIQLINKDKATYEVIEAELNETAKSNNVSSRIKQSLMEDAYNQAWLKPLLLAIEYGQVDKALSFITVSKDLHIEHVLPIQYSKYKEWTSLYTDKEATLYLNLLPNLTLLSGKKNIEASNSPFSEKIDIYKGKGKDAGVAYRTTQWIPDRVTMGNLLWDRETLNARFDWYKAEIKKEFGWDITSLSLDQLEVIQDEQEEEDEDDIEGEGEVKERRKVKFYGECIEVYSKNTGRNLEKLKRNTYKDPKDGLIVLCKISKEHTKYSEPSYWYGLDPGELEVLQIAPSNSVILLGCGSGTKLIVLPVLFILQNLENMGRTGDRHWHINIQQEGQKYSLELKDGGSADVSKYLLK
jgi:uncharacterized protein with ParB-like and HNH nuclease domain